MSVEATRHAGCDAVGPCRHMICARCGRHTINSTQGHYWAWCGVTHDLQDFHFCCPGDCELSGSGKEEVDPA